MIASAEKLADSNKNSARNTHYRVCNFCEAMCGLEVTYPDKENPSETEIVIKPDKQDPFSKGSMCPKAAALSALHTDPSKLRHPVKRVGDQWVTITWPEAYSLIEENLKRIQSEHGQDSVASYLGNPIVHNLGMMLFIKSFTQAIGSKNVFSATSMDQLPHHFAAHYMFGHEFRIPVPDVDRTDFMIIMGANPIASNGSIMTSAGIKDRLGHIKERGGQVVVIDPRETETARIATTHHFIRPATDVYLLLAILHVLYRDGLASTANLQKHLTGLEAIEQIASRVSPEVAADITGIDADVICQLTHDYANNDKAVIYGRMGLSTQPHGGLCHWLINTINIVSNHFDTPGGMMFPSPAIDLARHKQKNLVGRWKSRVRQMPEFYGELPVSAMTEELTTEGFGQVRAFITVCGNPVLSTPAGKRLDDVLPDIDFMLSIDNYINETTRHASVILPTPGGLEIDHFDIIFNLISVTNNVKFSEALFPPDDDRPADWQVLKELIHRFSPNKGGMFHALKNPRRIVNWGLMLGPYGKLSHPSRWFSGLSLKKVIDSKHGIGLGPLMPRIPDALLTKNNKINLTPTVFTSGLDALLVDEDLIATQLSFTQRDPTQFQLIGRRHVNTNNSWMHQFRKLSRSKQVRCTAMINTNDAHALGVVDGTRVRVSSSTGEITLPAEVSDSIRSGVVSIPHGFGHNRAGTQVPIADEKPGVSVNDITDHNHVDNVTGNAAFSGLWVSIESVETKSPLELPGSGKPLLVIYGSRTGNAEFTALGLASTAREHKLLAEVLCSTYGEGDMPDNATGLWDALNAADAPTLTGIHYSVLAFGDSSYENFCNAGKQWDRRLEELGAHRISPRVDCDTDYSDSADAWLDETLPAITVVGDQTLIESTLSNTRGITSAYSRANPIPASLVSKRLLTDASSSKETWHIELSFDDKNIHYVPGNIINVIPVNRPELVDELLTIVSNNAQVLNKDTSDTIKTQLQHELELRIPSPALIRLIAEQSPHEHVKALLKSKDSSAINDYLWGKDVFDLIEQNKGIINNAEELVSILSPLSHRSYSIASSLNVHPSSIHLTVGSVRYVSNGRHHCGTASCYFADMIDVGDTVNAYFAPDTSFTLPENDDAPIIMIGPGTGLAPFMGFIQERSFRKASGKNWLFFGDRNSATDFLYENELNDYLLNGVLTHLDLAFSRDQESKVYVQHRMLENSAKLYQWLQQGAIVYVCGDAKRMAADVDEALHDIVMNEGGKNKSSAEAYIEQLRQSKHYLLDVY